jgi:uncharacterized protein DUF2877
LAAPSKISTRLKGHRRNLSADALPHMKPASVDSQAVILQTGTMARTGLASGQHGKVLAVFSKAIYLLTEADELFWIARDDSPMHERCAQISSPLPGLLARSPFRVEDHRLTIDPGFICDVDHAPRWCAPRVDPNHVLETIQLPARIHSFFSNLDFSQAKGFGSFIPLILSLSRNESINPLLRSSDPILLFAQPFVLGAARACLDHQPFRISQTANALIGFGTGLTPSGDDFLGGFLFAVNQLQAAYPNSNFINHRFPIETYHSWTHLISFTLLKDLASGQAIAPLHHIIHNLLTGESLASVYPFVSQLTQIGHSTGWDLLTGLLTGLLITYRSSYSMPSWLNYEKGVSSCRQRLENVRYTRYSA